MAAPGIVVFLLFQVTWSIVDVGWLYQFYPPFDEVKLIIPLSEWLPVHWSYLHWYITCRSLVFIAFYFIWQSVFCKIKVPNVVGMYLGGVFVNWMGIILFGGYILSSLQDNLFLASLLTTEWWMLCMYLPHFHGIKNGEVIQLVSIILRGVDNSICTNIGWYLL